MITIRNLTIEDMEEAAKLQVLCWSEELVEKAQNTYVAKDLKDSWIKWMSSSEENNDVRLLIGAFEDNKMLGVAYSSFAETEDIPEKGIELNGLWVYPECRGKRISLKLIVHILNYYKNIGKEKLVIYNHHFAPSNEFYKKFGATVLRQDKQMGGKLLVDVFISDIDTFKSNVEKSLLKYEKPIQIIGNKIILTKATENDLEFLCNVESDKSLWIYEEDVAKNDEKLREKFKSRINGDRCFDFIVKVKEDKLKNPIGFVSVWKYAD